MIRACSCLPRLAGRQRTTDYATRMKALELEVLTLLHAAPSCRAEVPGVAISRGTSFTVPSSLCLARELCKVFFPKMLVAARRHSPSPEPESFAEVRPGRESPLPDSLAQPVQFAAAGFTLRGGGGRNHSLRPASLAPARVTRRGPRSIAAARVTRRGLQSITLHCNLTCRSQTLAAASLA